MLGRFRRQPGRPTVVVATPCVPTIRFLTDPRPFRPKRSSVQASPGAGNGTVWARWRPAASNAEKEATWSRPRQEDGNWPCLICSALSRGTPASCWNQRRHGASTTAGTSAARLTARLYPTVLLRQADRSDVTQVLTRAQAWEIARQAGCVTVFALETAPGAFGEDPSEAQMEPVGK